MGRGRPVSYTHLSGADAYLLHVTTTPSVAYVARVDEFDCGIMISASHNPCLLYTSYLQRIRGRSLNKNNFLILIMLQQKQKNRLLLEVTLDHIFMKSSKKNMKHYLVKWKMLYLEIRCLMSCSIRHLKMLGMHLI